MFAGGGRRPCARPAAGAWQPAGVAGPGPPPPDGASRRSMSRTDSRWASRRARSSAPTQARTAASSCPRKSSTLLRCGPQPFGAGVDRAAAGCPGAGVGPGAGCRRRTPGRRRRRGSPSAAAAGWRPGTTCGRAPRRRSPAPPAPACGSGCWRRRLRAMCWSMEMPLAQPAVGGPALRKLPIRIGRPVSRPPMPRVWCEPNPASASAMSTPPRISSFDRQGSSGARMRPKVKPVSPPRGRHCGADGAVGRVEHQQAPDRLPGGLGPRARACSSGTRPMPAQRLQQLSPAHVPHGCTSASRLPGDAGTPRCGSAPPAARRRSPPAAGERRLQLAQRTLVARPLQAPEGEAVPLGGQALLHLGLAASFSPSSRAPLEGEAAAVGGGDLAADRPPPARRRWCGSARCRRSARSRSRWDPSAGGSRRTGIARRAGRSARAWAGAGPPRAASPSARAAAAASADTGSARAPACPGAPASSGRAARAPPGIRPGSAGRPARPRGSATGCAPGARRRRHAVQPRQRRGDEAAVDGQQRRPACRSDPKYAASTKAAVSAAHARAQLVVELRVDAARPWPGGPAPPAPATAGGTRPPPAGRAGRPASAGPRPRSDRRCASSLRSAAASRRVVGHGPPQEVRQPGGHLVPVQRRPAVAPARRGRARPALDPVQERRRLQHRPQHHLDALGEAAAGAARLVQRQQAIASRPGSAAGGRPAARSAGRTGGRRPPRPLPAKSQPTSAGRSFTAAAASASAASWYFSASSGDTPSTAALLLKPPDTSSGGKRSAGAVRSPSRSRTVLLYSPRVSRRSGDANASRVVQAPAPPGGRRRRRRRARPGRPRAGPRRSRTAHGRRRRRLGAAADREQNEGKRDPHDHTPGGPKREGNLRHILVWREDFFGPPARAITAREVMPMAPVFTRNPSRRRFLKAAALLPARRRPPPGPRPRARRRSSTATCTASMAGTARASRTTPRPRTSRPAPSAPSSCWRR